MLRIRLVLVASLGVILQRQLGLLSVFEPVERPGIREQTRDEYDRLIHTYALEYFDPHTRLADIDTRAVQGFVDWLCRQPNRRPKAKGTLSDDSVRNAITPLRSMLAQAVREGEIPHNPCSGVKLPKSTVGWDEARSEMARRGPSPAPTAT